MSGDKEPRARPAEGTATHLRSALAQGDLDEADKLCRAVAPSTTDADLLRLCGETRLRQGRPDDAAIWAQTAVECDGGSAASLHLLARAAAASNHQARADEALILAVAKEPGHLPSRLDLARRLSASGRTVEAEEQFRHAVRQAPDAAVIWAGRGLNAARREQWDDARAWLERAIALDPHRPATLANLGWVLRRAGAPEDALAVLQRAVAIAPDHVEAQWNRAHALLTLGDYRAGFAAYEWRRQRASIRPHLIPGITEWTGQALAGKTLLVCAEQGAGDTIQMLRFAAPLADQGARVIIQCVPGLCSLAATAPGVSASVALGTPPPAVDYQIPALSLPHRLDIEAATLPAPPRYVQVPPGAHPPTALSRLPSGRKRIGVVWRGNPAHPEDRPRSLPVALLAPLAQRDDVALISFQVPTLGTSPDFDATPPPFALNIAEDLTSYAMTAAALTAVDLLICVDTSVLHLAGALGVPAWGLLHKGGDWRWGAAGTETIWYPSIRLFRQTERGAWADVIDAVCARLTSTA